MTAGKNTSQTLGLLGFALLLLIPSIDTVLKYSGVTGIFAYIAAGTAAIIFCWRFVLPVMLQKIGDKPAILVGPLICVQW